MYVIWRTDVDVAINILGCDDQTEFTCRSSGRCILIDLQCDSYTHCEDNSDETSECGKSPSVYVNGYFLTIKNQL